MSEIRDDIPGPSKRKAIEENQSDGFSTFKKPCPDGDPTPPDEVPPENWPMARPRHSYLLLAPEEGHNLLRILNDADVDPVSPILCLVDEIEACAVLDCSRLTNNSTKFQVFDEHNTPYTMQSLNLLGQTFKLLGNNSVLFIRGWRSFVEDHKLGAGDHILFNKNLDTTISNDFYYILQYVKKPESSKKQGDGAESSRKPDDGAESSREPGDGTESSTKLSDDGAESSRKPGDSAESRRKSGDTTESSSTPSDDSFQSVLGIGMPVFKVIYHRVLLESPSDQEQRIAPRLGSRPFPLEAICLSKTLNEAELGSWLYFDVYDAIVLSDNPRVAQTPSDFSVNFGVSDRNDRRRIMKLRHFEMQGGIFGFCLDGWDRFIMNHNLKRGDRVAFYKFLDRRIRNGYYFVVLKLPVDVDCQNRRNPFRPGSRELMPGSECFSKILSEDDLSPGAAGLQLEALQARHFESSMRSLNEPFMVFDWDDRQYEMKLSYYFNSERELMCFLDNSVGWHSFVLRNHLRAGDTIHVNKTFDQSVCADHYFVITLTRTVFRGQLETEF